MKNLQLLTICLTAILFFTNCNKYEDGSNFSVRTKTHRVDGKWRLSSYTINGQNQLFITASSSMTTSCSTSVSYVEMINYTHWDWAFTKNGNFQYESTADNQLINSQATYDNCMVTYTISSIQNFQMGTWQFISDKEKIQLNYDNGNRALFDIKELREGKMVLINYDNSNITELSFIKI